MHDDYPFFGTAHDCPACCEGAFESPRLDPLPWIVDEADGRRYSMQFVRGDYEEDGREGIVRALARWAPREGYAQKEEDYA